MMKLDNLKIKGDTYNEEDLKCENDLAKRNLILNVDDL